MVIITVGCWSSATIDDLLKRTGNEYGGAIEEDVLMSWVIATVGIYYVTHLFAEKSENGGTLLLALLQLFVVMYFFVRVL